MKLPTQFARITPAEMEKLSDQGVKPKHFTNALPMLIHNGEPWRGAFGLLNIMFYIDRFGDFMSSTTMTARIVRALYNSLETGEKMQINNYLMMDDDDE